MEKWLTLAIKFCDEIVEQNTQNYFASCQILINGITN